MAVGLCEAQSPAVVVAAARRWIGTPYLHQASRLGAGCDCLGLVRGLWREVVGPEPEPLPPYRATWAEDGAAALLEATALRHLPPAPAGPPEAGDVLLFRLRAGGPVKHVGVATGPAAMIHAYEGHAVAETPIPPGWARRLAARFRFPVR
jgi:NlpC/P60 family putative phage cell wall peptidase